MAGRAQHRTDGVAVEPAEADLDPEFPMPASPPRLLRRLLSATLFLMVLVPPLVAAPAASAAPASHRTARELTIADSVLRHINHERALHQLRSRGLREIRGAAQAVELTASYRRSAPFAHQALISGSAGIVITADGGQPTTAMAFTFAAGKITEIYILADRSRLTRLGLAPPGSFLVRRAGCNRCGRSACRTRPDGTSARPRIIGDPREVGPRTESHSVTGAGRRRSRRRA